MITAELIAAAFVIQGIGFALVFKNGYRGMRQQPTKYTKMFDMIPLGNALMALLLLAAVSSLLANVNVGQDVVFNSVQSTYLFSNTVNATTYLNLPGFLTTLPSNAAFNYLYANYITASNSIGGNYLYANFINAGTYLNLPATVATCGSVCTANTFIGFNAISALYINSSTSNFITARTYSGNIVGNNGIFTNLNSVTFSGNVAGNNAVLTNAWAVTFNGNVIGSNAAFSGVLSSTVTINSPIVGTNTISTTNGLFTDVGQIRWHVPIYSNIQWTSGKVYTNNNATEWIIYAEVTAPQSTTPKLTVREDELTNPSNIVYDAQAYIAGSNTLQTFIVPYGISFNAVWTKYVFNSIFVR